MLKSTLFNCTNKDKYPPFKNGLYLEEYFYNKMINLHDFMWAGWKILTSD